MTTETSNLSKMTDAELIAGVNRALGQTVPSLTLFNDELWRRDAARREERMLRLTRTIEQLTWVVTSATIGALVFALVALLR